MGTVLNFTYEVIVPKDGATWGSEQYDGTWNGMMRLVIDQKARVTSLNNDGLVFITTTWHNKYYYY